MSNPGEYWMSRAAKEQQLAKKSQTRGEADFHRDLARRFLDIAFSANRQTLNR
jgi:hypothetical protein